MMSSYEGVVSYIHTAHPYVRSYDSFTVLTGDHRGSVWIDRGVLISVVDLIMMLFMRDGIYRLLDSVMA